MDALFVCNDSYLEGVKKRDKYSPCPAAPCTIGLFYLIPVFTGHVERGHP